MKTIYAAGDISKEKIDFCLFDGEKVLLKRQVKNEKTDLKKFVKEITNFAKSTKEDLFKEVIFVFEYTGIYNNLIVESLETTDHKIALIHPGVLKAVVVVDRNKTDEIDAKRIAEYAHRFRDKLNYLSKGSSELKELKILMSERKSLIKTKAQLTAKSDDQSKFLDTETYMFLKNNRKDIIENLDDAIDNIEKKILKIIKGNTELSESYYNAISVPGVGPVTASVLIIVTENFTKFKSAKQLGCYCGVVPFERSSGTYKGKQRVSNKANKQLKTLLHMGALSVMSSTNLMGKYYQRKVEEGKNKMSALNNLRNKILKTTFSCVVNKQKYKADFQYQMAS